MFICPTCKKEYKSEELMSKHFLDCWKELHPNHKSNDAPRSDDLTQRFVSNDINSFFERLNNGRKND